MMEGLLSVVGWMLAGGLIAWWGIWPFIGRSLVGAGCLTVVPTLSWLVVAALGLAGPAVSLEVRVRGGGGVDLGPVATAVAVALLAGAVTAWLVPFVTVGPVGSRRSLTVGALLLLSLIAWPGAVDAPFLWGLFVVGRSGPFVPAMSVLLVLALVATAVLGSRASRRMVRAVLRRRSALSSGSVLPWVAGAVSLVPALHLVGLAAALALVLFIPPLAVVTRPRGMALAVWSAGLGTVAGCAAGLGSLMGLPGGALAVLVVAVAGGLPRGLRSAVDREAS